MRKAPAKTAPRSRPPTRNSFRAARSSQRWQPVPGSLTGEIARMLENEPESKEPRDGQAQAGPDIVTSDASGGETAAAVPARRSRRAAGRPVGPPDPSAGVVPPDATAAPDAAAAPDAPAADAAPAPSRRRRARKADT